MLDGNSQVPVEENNEPEKQSVDSLQMVRLIFFLKFKAAESV